MINTHNYKLYCLSFFFILAFVRLPTVTSRSCWDSLKNYLEEREKRSDFARFIELQSRYNVNELKKNVLPLFIKKINEKHMLKWIEMPDYFYSRQGLKRGETSGAIHPDCMILTNDKILILWIYRIGERLAVYGVLIYKNTPDEIEYGIRQYKWADRVYILEFDNGLFFANQCKDYL